MANKPEMLLLISYRRGQYIPRDFANSFADRAKHVRGVSDEAWRTLEAGPDHERYWETWDDVCNNATVTDDETGAEYHIYEGGDCWLVPVGMVWNGETFIWPEEEV